MSPSPRKVAIIGGGYAGMAAAVRLAQANIRVNVFESAHTLGGRARAIQHRGLTLDNGQHILIGAYRSLLELMRTVGMREDSALLRLPLEMNLHPDFHLRTPPLPAPLHLAWGLFTAKGLRFSERVAATRLTRLVERESLPPALEHATVSELLAATRQPERLIKLMWLPLCVAALNTPIEAASATVFARVMRDALFNQRSDSDFLLPKVDLSSLFPQPAADWLQQQGHEVLTGTRVKSIAQQDGAWTLEHSAHSDKTAGRFDALVIATGPHQLDNVAGVPPALPRAARFEPICTVYLQFESDVALPTVMTGQASGCVQWFFRRSALGGPPGLVAGVISASGPHLALDREGIAALACQELASLAGPLPPLQWSQVITERFATFACTPDIPRTPVESGLAGVYMAGDHTEGPYPATLEGAVRSGERAALFAIRYVEGLVSR